MTPARLLGETIASLKRAILRTPAGPAVRSVYRAIMPAPPPPSPAESFLLSHIVELERTDPWAGHHRWHVKRYRTTLDFLPVGAGRLLDLGGYNGLFAVLLEQYRSQYSLAVADHSHADERFRFDFEEDRLPFSDGDFDVVLFMEVLEHLTKDPMHAMLEINRVLKVGGLLLLTTPNICSWQAIRRALNHEHPGLFVPYIRSRTTDRHNREYTAHELRQLMRDAGFDIVRFETVDVYPDASGRRIRGYDGTDRGDTTFSLGKKISGVVNRMPDRLYWPPSGTGPGIAPP